VTRPNAIALVIIVGFVVSGLEEFGIAMGAADIFRRPVAFPGDAERMLVLVIARNEVFDLDKMLPSVAKIAFIEKNRMTDVVEIEILEAYFGRFERLSFVGIVLSEFGCPLRRDRR
jgi:hypothetical protein